MGKGVSSMVGLLKHKYEALREYCEMDSREEENVYTIIRKELGNFTGMCKNPAIWCYGMHTKMLMADFMFEMKNVHCIIDNGGKKAEDSGFEIIDESRIYEKRIDGVIISSYVYRNEIKERMKEKYSDIPYFDIYDELAKKGEDLERSYYSMGHPYVRYCKLNVFQRDFRQAEDAGEAERILKRIIQIYVEIKDFRSAILYVKKLPQMLSSAWWKGLLELLEDIYGLQQKVMEKIDCGNVLMLCVDGLRRKDITEGCMGNLCGFLQDTHYFCNTYSLSTSTFESLMPAYSENDDLRTKYYEADIVPENGCRFINEAKRQGRRIFFYTDGIGYIEDHEIRVTQKAQTATEKLWDFLFDAASETNGLFYIHILYESHFSYPNPYTEDGIIAEGTHILFDYLKKNGGQVRADYDKQQKDALKYLDDVVVPLIKRLRCRMVFYADHGNIVFGRDTDIGSIERTKYTFHEDLIQVPFAVKAPEAEAGRDYRLNSLMELNNVIISLMNQERIPVGEKRAVKVLRSEIYNPDFRYLYQKTGNAHGLLAFEAFVFDEGYKLVVFSDGVSELYVTETDSRVEDIWLKKRLLDEVADRITVCTWEKIGQAGL